LALLVGLINCQKQFFSSFEGPPPVLTQLNIQGLAIIDSLSIDFSHGFNVITGETGAGKSILIKALGLLLGAKASPETVRRGRESGSVTGLFEAPADHRCLEVLKTYEIPVEKEGDHFGILVRRSVTIKGRSQAWINDVPVTANVLRDLASTLIDVFGQHDNQRLLDPAFHTAYLDQFLKDKTLLPSYQEAYHHCHSMKQALTAMIEEFRAKRRDADYLAFRCEELKNFAPEKEDYEQISAICKRAGNVLEFATSLEKAQSCLDQGADGEPLSRVVWEAARLLSKLDGASPELKHLAEEANAIAGRLDDLSYQVGRSVSSLDVDEQELEAAQDRLAGYQELFRKLAAHDIDQLLVEKDRLMSELSFLESASNEVEMRLAEMIKAAKELEALGHKLTAARKKARDIIKNRIETELHELAMPGATIDIEFSSVLKAIPTFDIGLFGRAAADMWASVSEIFSGLSDSGAERSQFMLSSNPGEAAMPLQKIASGGEISRIMLALKRSLAAGADTCILVFDEIDAGISGRVADVVGRKMQELADSFQVICISHLAQVAAYAESHFLVHKFDKDRRTESTITKLSRKDSEAEIARLLSGAEVTSSSLANARALVTKASREPIKKSKTPVAVLASADKKKSAKL
jgi:DNA repair protein RecN (Recombination protein N)